jgi:CubicO group peptidase (beta-lactamase class C family)
VVSYSVSQRTQEIGIRVALGARAGDVSRLVLREGLLLGGLGVAVGLAAALASTRVLESLLFEVTPTDPVTLGAVAGLLLAVAVAATVCGRRAAPPRWIRWWLCGTSSSAKLGCMSPSFRVFVLIALALPVAAQLPPAATAKIDAAAEKALADSGAPSVSIAVVKDGRIAYVKAYGKARLDPATAARPDMRYCIGSVSKQFMAGAILLLVQDGKLSLDDKVGRYLPNLTRANEITIRQLLSHTSGYRITIRSTMWRPSCKSRWPRTAS